MPADLVLDLSATTSGLHECLDRIEQSCAGWNLPRAMVARLRIVVEELYANTINQIPGASNLPVLGALFRSSDWRRNETELVIIVTPHPTSPVKDIRQLPNPLQETAEATAIDVMLDGKAAGTRPPANPDGDLAPAGQLPAGPPPGPQAAAAPRPTTLAASKP